MSLWFRRLCKISCASLLSVAASVGATPTTGPSASFPQLVLSHFDQWDLDHDGVISTKEIDEAIVGHGANGPAAAAMVTCRRALHPRSFDPKMPKLTRDLFASWDDKSPVGKTLDDSFEHALKQVLSRPAGLFSADASSDGVAKLSCMRQGQIGDCFFIAPTGAFTNRDPSALRKMIDELPNQAGYHVTFANGQAVDVPPITDAEYAFGASTAGQGLWLPVLEQAYSRIKMQTLPEEKRSAVFTDAITRGGMSKNVIALYTGHSTHAIVLRSVKHTKIAATRPEDADNDQANHSNDLDTAERNRADLAMPTKATIEKLRDALKDAMANHRLVTAGGLARTEDMPPDMSANHVYAIVGYDAENDIVKVWNPHGQDYTPKGPDGLRYGFKTRHGRFDVPTDQFVQVFRSATFETNDPATQPAAQPAMQPAVTMVGN